jgi:hypothetical protein
VITNNYHRKVSIVNIDPANDHIPYPCAVNIADLITLDDVMEEFGLGPNGGMMYCMEYLEKNLDWLIEKLKPLKGNLEAYSTRKLLEKVTNIQYLCRRLHLIRLSWASRAVYSSWFSEEHSRAVTENQLSGK